MFNFNKFILHLIKFRLYTHVSYLENPLNELVEIGDIPIFIDNKALFQILGSNMDYVEDCLSAEFVLDYPNVKSTCGCGESFNL